MATTENSVSIDVTQPKTDDLVAEVDRLRELVVMLLNRTFEGRVELDAKEQDAIAGQAFIIGSSQDPKTRRLSLWVERAPVQHGSTG